jgi:hypothetical protein
MRYYFATVLKAWDSARPVGTHRKITPIFGVRGRGIRPHMADAVIEDLLQLLTTARGPGCVKSPIDAMILRVNRQLGAMDVRLRRGD